jgi:hypothetical protein
VRFTKAPTLVEETPKYGGSCAEQVGNLFGYCDCSSASSRGVVLVLSWVVGCSLYEFLARKHPVRNDVTKLSNARSMTWTSLTFSFTTTETNIHTYHSLTYGLRLSLFVSMNIP